MAGMVRTRCTHGVHTVRVRCAATPSMFAFQYYWSSFWVSAAWHAVSDNELHSTISNNPRRSCASMALSKHGGVAILFLTTVFAVNKCNVTWLCAGCRGKEGLGHVCGSSFCS